MQDPFPPSVTQIVMSAYPDGYGYKGRASIRPINNQGNGPTTSFDLERAVNAPSPPSNLTYEIREDDLVAYFSWDAPSISYAPASAELYYKVNYVTDAGVSRTKYYSSDFASLDLTSDEYWDYHVSACIFEVCSNPSSIRARLTIREFTKVGNDFESDLTGEEGAWVSNGWTRNSGSTPSSSTGPQAAVSGSFYAYFETSPAQTGDIATLESTNDNVFDRLYFSYHMYGSSMGSLYVDVDDGGTWNTIWQKTGQQHSSSNRAWTGVELDLSAYDFRTRVRFRGVDGNSYRGDMAIDNVRITKFEEVEVEQSAFEYHFLNDKAQTPGIFAIEDNTQIQLNYSIPVTLAAGSSVDLGQVIQGDVIYSDRPIAIGSNTDGTDMPVPIEFAGSDFVIPLQRQTHYIYVKNINSFNVNVDFYDGNSTTTQTIAAGNIVRLDTTLNGVSAIIKVEGERNVLVSHRTSSNADAYPVPPSSLEVFGIRSTGLFGVQEDNTTIDSFASNGNVVIQNRGKGYRGGVIGTNGADGAGDFVRILADKPIAAVQYADSDGAEQTGFWPLSMFATDYVLPVDVQYVAIGCISDTNISVYSSSGSYLQDVSCNGSRVHPGKAFLGSSSIENVVQLSAGTKIVSDEPIYLIYETFATDDEHNLMGLADTDGDGIYNSQDDDIDNDGEPDVTDAFPFDNSEQGDFDGDGIGNNVDTDDDIDGINTNFNLKAEYSASPHGLKISWNEIAGASYYELVRSTNNGNSWVDQYSGSNEEFIDSDIDGFNGALYYRIRACNSSCSSWTSTPASAQ